LLDTQVARQVGLQ